MESINTYKSGKFIITKKYNREDIDPKLIRAIVLNETVKDLPILPSLADRLEPEIIYSSIAGTAAIEGNPITEEDAKKIYQGEHLEIYTKKHMQEILNLIKAYEMLEEVEAHKERFIFNEKLIKLLHQTITNNVEHDHNIPGKYRNGKVHVGDKAHGGIYTPPKVLDDVKNLMKAFVQWANSEEILELNPFIRAALCHYYFCLIHPFWDGNGRTARLLETMILQAADIKYAPKELSNYYYRNVDDYYIAFSKSIKLKTDNTPFIEFILDAAIFSLDKIKKKITYFIRLFSLRDYFAHLKENREITQRQHDLLKLLLDYPGNFTQKELFAEIPFSILYRKVSRQTARRDLKKLKDRNLIKSEGGGSYSLNIKALG